MTFEQLSLKPVSLKALFNPNESEQAERICCSLFVEPTVLCCGRLRDGCECDACLNTIPKDLHSLVNIGIKQIFFFSGRDTFKIELQSTN